MSGDKNALGVLKSKGELILNLAEKIDVCIHTTAENKAKIKSLDNVIKESQDTHQELSISLKEAERAYQNAVRANDDVARAMRALLEDGEEY